MSSVNAYFIVKWYNLVKNDIKNKNSLKDKDSFKNVCINNT